MRFTRQPNHRRYIFQSVFVLAWTIAAVRTCLCRSISISIGGLFFLLFVYYARFAWVRCSQSCVCVILRVRNQLRHKIDFDRTKIYRFNKYSKGFLKKWRSLPSNAFSAFIRLGSHIAAKLQYFVWNTWTMRYTSHVQVYWDWRLENNVATAVICTCGTCNKVVKYWKGPANKFDAKMWTIRTLNGSKIPIEEHHMEFNVN